MARKKKKEAKEVEEEYEFVPPEFDEKDFLQKDLLSTRAVMITAIFGLVLAICGFLLSSIDMVLGWIPLLAGLVSLRYIFKLVNVPDHVFEKKSALVGNYLMLALLFLGLWIVMLNPPISDHSPPSVTDVDVWYYDDIGNLTQASVDSDGRLIVTSVGEGDLNITARVVDNGGVQRVEMWRNWTTTWSGENSVLMDLDDADGHQWDAKFDPLSDFGNETSGTITYFLQFIAYDEGGNVEVTGLFILRVSL